MNWFLVLVCSILGFIIWWYYLYFKHDRYLSKYKGPPVIPILGNLHTISSPDDLFPVLMKFQQRYGTVLKMWFGYRPRLIISDYRVAELLLGSTSILDKAYNYRYLHPWLGTGLLTSAGTKWKRHRKLLTPAFHFKILEQFITIFNAQSNILIEKLQAVDNKDSFDIFPYINLCALDIICEATMGTQVNAQKNSDSVYVRSVKGMCRIMVDRTISVIKMSDFLFKFTSASRDQSKILSVLHGYSRSVIKSRQKELSGVQKHLTQNEDDVGMKNRMAFLDLLIKCKIDGKPLSDDVIREEVDTFMFEGHDTITSAISFTLYCLSLHFDVQNAAMSELKGIFGNDTVTPPTYQNLQDMKYLEMVIKESLRLYPSVSLFGRQITEDIEFDGVLLPKDTNLAIFAFGLHRQEDVYPDPEKFDPERFTLENSSKRSPFAYVPFSAGPRNCIGQRFAMLEMKSVVSKVLRKFEILPVPNYKPILTQQVVLKSKNGVLVGLKQRKF